MTRLSEIIDIYARAQIEKHEAVCAERYDHVAKQMEAIAAQTKQTTNWLITLVGVIFSSAFAFILRVF